MASLAASSLATVCIADKSLCYGDQIQWDSDSSKMFLLNPSGTVVLFAGGQRDAGELIARLITIQDQLGIDKSATKRQLEAECSKAIDFLVDRQFLAPRQLTRLEYVAAISGGHINPYMESIAREIHNYQFDCSLLVCGCDKLVPFILDLDYQGVVTDYTSTGFQAIGAGWEKATSRLLFSEHEREHSIGRVLYDLFDAKANAEMTPSVGYEWDAWIVLPGNFGGVHLVPKPIKELIEIAWEKFNRSPFEKYDPKQHSQGPPRDWREQLSQFSYLILKAKGPDTEDAKDAQGKLKAMNNGRSTLLTPENSEDQQ